VATSRSWHLADDDDYEDANAELKRRFAAWAEQHGLEVDPEAPELALHYKWGYLDGHLTRWRTDDLDEVYLELFPAKVMLEPDEIGQVLEEAKAFVRFLAQTGLLANGSDPADVLVEHLGSIEGEFRAAMSDPSRHGMAKRFMTAAAAEGVTPDDEEGLQAFIQRFNARSRAARDAVLRAPTLSARGRVTPPGTRPRPSSAKRRKRRS
jgi:hypothetical protein